jgi:hypothetical protein
MVSLLSGAGLRREECCHLRVHSLDLARQGPAGVTSPLDLLGGVATADVQAALEERALGGPPAGGP